MRSKPTLVGTLLLLAATPLVAQTNAQTGEIRVTVRVEGTQTPISGAEVSLKECGDCFVDLPDNEKDLLAYLEGLAAARGIVTGRSQVRPVEQDPLPTATTDDAGDAVLRNVKFGRYNVVVGRAGYIGVWGGPSFARGSTVVMQSSLGVELDPDHRIVNASLSLVRTAVIRGHVRDANGAPLAGVSVTLWSVFSQGPRILSTPHGAAMTNAAGEYVLTAETPGEFFLRARIAGMADAYYPGNTNLQNASPVSLQAGTNLTNIDFQLK